MWESACASRPGSIQDPDACSLRLSLPNCIGGSRVMGSIPKEPSVAHSRKDRNVCGLSCTVVYKGRGSNLLPCTCGDSERAGQLVAGRVSSEVRVHCCMACAYSYPSQSSVPECSRAHMQSLNWIPQGRVRVYSCVEFINIGINQLTESGVRVRRSIT